MGKCGKKLICRMQNAYNLVQSENLSFGKRLDLCQSTKSWMNQNVDDNLIMAQTIGFVLHIVKKVSGKGDSIFSFFTMFSNAPYS